MGEAKRRGTYEERKREALERRRLFTLALVRDWKSISDLPFNDELLLAMESGMTYDEAFSLTNARYMRGEIPTCRPGVIVDATGYREPPL